MRHPWCRTMRLKPRGMVWHEGGGAEAHDLGPGVKGGGRTEQTLASCAFFSSRPPRLSGMEQRME
jgi:hypothetical protein